jgi:hypothetical protein
VINYLPAVNDRINSPQSNFPWKPLENSQERRSPSGAADFLQGKLFAAGLSQALTEGKYSTVQEAWLRDVRLLERLKKAHKASVP